MDLNDYCPALVNYMVYCVPNLQFDTLVTDCDHLGSELYTDCDFVFLSEAMVDEL